MNIRQHRITINESLITESAVRIGLPDGRKLVIHHDGSIDVIDTTLGSIGNEYMIELPTVMDVAQRCEATGNHVTVEVHHRH